MHFSVSKQSSALDVGVGCRKIYIYIFLCTHLSLAHNGLAAGVPVPEQHGAVLAPAHDVAVAGVVTFRPGKDKVRK